MKIFVYRESTVMVMTVGHKEDAITNQMDPFKGVLFQGRWAMISYQGGFTQIFQKHDEPTFMVMAECGPQFSREEIEDIFLEIQRADVNPDEKVVVLHRVPPSNISVNKMEPQNETK